MSRIKLLMGGAAIFSTTILMAIVSEIAPEALRDLTGFAVLVMAWCIAPFAAAALTGWLVRRSSQAVTISLSGLVVVFVVMAGLIGLAIQQPAPQSGLVIVFAPIYAFAILTPFLLSAWWYRATFHSHA